MPLRNAPMAELIAEIRAMPGEVSRTLGKELKAAGKPVLNQARRNAAWSSRIPGAMSLRSTRSKRWPGVRIVVKSKDAPHARLYEFGHDRRGFRHPVFGNMEVWVQQTTRPFISPAFKDNVNGFALAADRAVSRAARRRGFSH